MYAYRNNENGAIRKNFTEKKLDCIWGREDVWKSVMKKNVMIKF